MSYMNLPEIFQHKSDFQEKTIYLFQQLSRTRYSEIKKRYLMEIIKPTAMALPILNLNFRSLIVRNHLNLL